MRLSAIASLAGLLSTSVYAAPHGNDTIIEPHVLDVLAGKNIKTTLDPQYDLKCPKTSNYEEHTYTRGQLKAAFLTASKLDANAKQIGDNKYPHAFNSNQAFPNGCGTNTREFPIKTDGKVYDGESVKQIGDRILYEMKEFPNEIQVKFCATIRHNNDNDLGFDNCP